MNYLIGLKLPSPVKEQAKEQILNFLNEAQWTLNGRIFINIGESILDNSSFHKLLDHLQPNDLIMFYNSYLSVPEINDYLQLIQVLAGCQVNILDLLNPMINSFDYPLVYCELIELVELMRDYLDFLYKLHTENFAIDLSRYSSTYDIDPRFSSFIQKFLIDTVKRHKFFSDATYYFTRFQTEQARSYIGQQLQICSNLPYGWDWDSLMAFNDLVESLKTITNIT